MIEVLCVIGFASGAYLMRWGQPNAAVTGFAVFCASLAVSLFLVLTR